MSDRATKPKSQERLPGRQHDPSGTAARSDGEVKRSEDAAPAGSDDRGRRRAAAALLDPAIPPAGAGAMLDADPRLDDRSETEAALERAKGTPD